VLPHDVYITWLEVGVDSVSELCARWRIDFNMAGVGCWLFTLTVRQGVPESSIMCVLGLRMALLKLKLETELLLLVGLLVLFCTFS